MPPMFTRSLILLTLLPSLALADAQPLPPAEAFRYEVSADAEQIYIDWELEPGYYLYQKKLAVSTPAGGSIEALDFPPGLDHEDDYFGKQTVYRDQFRLAIAHNAPAGKLPLTLESQGCADFGICYPPQRWETEVTIPAGSGSNPLASGRASDVATQISLAGGSNEFLPPYEAFVPIVTLLDGQTFELAWQIQPGYYLYRHNIKVVAPHPAVSVAESLPLPKGKAKFDEYFGETEVYYDSLIAKIPLAYSDNETTEFVLELGYQGCAEDGICYPPLKRYVEVDLRKLSATLLGPDEKPAPLQNAASGVPATTAAAVASVAPRVAGKESVQDKLARQIREGNLALVMSLFFLAGLGLALTPCVLPMIPILSGIIAGDKEETTALRGFSLSLTYVLGMALTYTIAGAVFAMAGQQAQAAFQHPAVLIGFAGLFVVLAISMFGAFELQMPSALQTRLAAVSGNQKSGTFIGAFVMGALSSLIVTACVAPPLIAALSVISQTGDVVRGGGALFAMSMGMGAPLLVVGASAGKLIPKAGAWMEKVKIAFGFIMLALAIYILSRLLPGSLTLALFGALLIVAAVYFGGLDALAPEASGGARVARALGLIGIVYGAVMIVGALTGGHDPLRPVALSGQAAVKEEKLSFTPVQSLTELEQHLTAAKAAGQPVMLDFYADWCVSCKEMEKYTFTDPGVNTALSGTRLLKADVTANNDDHQALLKRFGLFGPPSIIFFDTSGTEQPGYQVVGMMWPEEFTPHVQELTALGSS